jgi:hypothetical protein
LRPEELSDDAKRVADRLQELSADEAERILQRAVDLQTRAPGPDPTGTLDTQMLQQIADELDIDRTHLQQALLEELFRVETEHPTWLDRLVVDDAISGHGAAPGEVRAVREVVDAWMTNEEGMRKRAENSSRTVWEKDRGFGAVARKFLRLSRGSQALRTASSVTTAVRPATDDQQVVVIEADTRNLRRLALGLLAAAGGIGVAVAASSGAIDPNGFGLDNVAAGAVTTAVLGGGVLIGVKMWAQRIRDGVARAIDAIRSPHLVDRGTSLPSTLRRFVDQFRRVGVDVRDEWRGDPRGPF